MYKELILNTNLVNILIKKSNVTTQLFAFGY